jgi:DNA-binding GntR family transcriptional regulator
VATTSRAEKKFRSITKLIAENLRKGILAGKLAPGERFSEEKLAASLKVSRVPLRDALRRLEAEGYVTFKNHDEIAISKPTLDEIEDYYSIAGVLEGLAARLAVERGSAEEIARLRELHQLLKQAYQDKDLVRYFDTNAKFHSYIAEMARNERLHRLIRQVRQEIQKTRILTLHLPHRPDYSMREHDQILDAFLKRNPELAQSLVLSHMNNQMKTIKKLLQSEGAKHA